MSDDVNGKTQNIKITIYVDDVPYQVSPDNNLLAGVLSNKLKLPYFCWHPSMGSVGACRQCAVTQYMDENDTRGRLVMSCMTPVVDGMRIGLTDKASAKFREQVIAAMMTNHPHDCPVCAEGGECHLQDMTVMTGHSARQYRGEKRTFTNQYLGELVGHEMNRCITCYRCVRFYKDYAGGKDFDVFGSRNQVYFGRQKDGVLESAFSGNLVEVCPTGVFTNKLFSAHYTRKWDLQSAPSVCAHCSIGCNTSIGERYGSVRRVMNRYNHELNGYFLCDRGRFGIGFVNSMARIRTIKGVNSTVDELSVGLFNEKKFAKEINKHSSESFIGIGSSRASFEANRLVKYLVGRENFSLGYTNQEMQLALRHKQLLVQYPQQSLTGMEHRVHQGSEAKEHDLVVLIGENIEQTAPRLALTIKQVLRNSAREKADSIGVKHWQDSAVRTYAGNTTTPLFSLQAQQSEFVQQANGALVLSVQQIITCVEHLTQMLKAEFISHIVVPLKTQQSNPESNATERANQGCSSQESVGKDLSDQESEFLLLLANALSQAKMPLIVTGLSLKSPKLLSAIDNLMACLSQKSHVFSPELTVVAPECNSVGNLHFLDEHNLSIEQIIKRCSASSAENKAASTSLLILEQDLAQLSHQQLQQLRQHCKTMIVLDHTKNKLTKMADIVLPVAAVSESNGHFVNYQGRLQRFSSAHIAVKPIMENWYWLGLLAKHLFVHQEVNFSSLTQLQSFFAEDGEPWALQVLTCQQYNRHVARQTHRASGRTAMTANQSVHECKTFLENGNNQEDFRYSMEGDNANSSPNMPYAWAPAWNSNQSIFQYQQEVNGELNHQGNENLLNLSLSVFFDDTKEENVDEKLEKLWPCKVFKRDGDLTLIQNIPWFLAEQQTRNLPEFILMFVGNSIEMSTELATQNGHCSGDVLKLVIDGQQLFGKVKVNEKQPRTVVLVSLFDLPMSINNVVITAKNMSKATTEEVTEFQQIEHNRKQTAQQEKADILTRLKKQDQIVPISFIIDESKADASEAEGKPNA
ncbi:NADH-quinone oxidoreductase subunit NuoG [Candidatus Colwellia aromaticivorans]|uniref:NADH-quinone oxidoreductase subunit NuoG n=1 Tax=Candidatus Colwellia aromaticivorans TaxID=2267621 RepID=UPI000DF21C7E|nr:NADH-quinone oxidoreductase subunit NuoG [Candidatus Colwellia aromaticivorans]